MLRVNSLPLSFQLLLSFCSPLWGPYQLTCDLSLSLTHRHTQRWLSRKCVSMVAPCMPSLHHSHTWKLYTPRRDRTQSRHTQIRAAERCRYVPWAEPGLWSQTDMPHACLRYLPAVNVNLERSLSLLICTMGMRTPSREAVSTPSVGYPQQAQAQGGNTVLFLFIIPASQVLWKDPPRGCPVPPYEDTSSLGPFADAPHMTTCLS